MGFYGNITNTSRTQFQFDKIYPNRRDMQAQTTTDGIYAGRYVLVEYDSEVNLDTYIEAQQKYSRIQDGKTVYALAYNPQGEVSDLTTLKRSQVQLGDVAYIVKDIPDLDDNIRNQFCYFYSCITEYKEGSTADALFVEIADAEVAPNYTINYNIDINRFGQSRGYDSTVWQKVYAEGVEKYVMIAELNTVVPHFDIVADAPTMRPLVPHFDITSTDVYYKLHWQPQWGFKIKEAEANSESSINPNNYESDYLVSQEFGEYDPATDTTTIFKTEYPGAIYFNRNGFDFTTFRPSSDIADLEVPNKSDVTVLDNIKSSNEIAITPEGMSGHTYNTHNGVEPTKQVDTQELRILLPAIGDTIAKVWNTMYGYNPENNIRYRDIGWKNVFNGDNLQMMPFNTEYQGEADLGYMTRDLNTVAGCINNVHDLMGMIVAVKNDIYLNENYFQKNWIYKQVNDINDLTNQTFYRIYKYPLYNYVNELPNYPLLEDRSNYTSDAEYTKAYDEAVRETIQDKQIYKIIGEITDAPLQVELYSGALFNVEDISKLVYLNGEFGYKFVEIEELGKNLNTILGCILQMKKLLEVEDSETRDSATVQGAINKLNDIINLFGTLIPGEFVIIGPDGSVQSASWTTAQNYSYTNYKDANPEEQTTEKENFEPATLENRWLKLEVDENTREITLQHMFNPINDTTTKSNKNVPLVIENAGLNNSNGDSIDLYTPIVDNKGHIVGRNTETVILPFGYKYIVSNGLSDNDSISDLYTDFQLDNVNGDNKYIAEIASDENEGAGADSTQDTLQINSYNKWIQIEVKGKTHDKVIENDNYNEIVNPDNDIINIAHETHTINETIATPTDLNDGTDTIVLQDMRFDNAGHLVENHSHTYTLPFSYKQFKSSGLSYDPKTQDKGPSEDLYTDINNIESGANTSTATIDEDQNSGTVANNTQDILFINPANEWIQIGVTEDNIKIAHEIHSVDTQLRQSDLNHQLINNRNGKDTITIQDISYDKAGHIIGDNAHTYTLPFGYKYLRSDAISSNAQNDIYTKVIKNTGNDDESSMDQDKINQNVGSDADNTQDILYINPENKWIQVKITDDNVGIGHEIHAIKTVKANDTDLNVERNIIPQDTVTWQDTTYDTAGHVVENRQHTYILPYSYKFFESIGLNNSTNDLYTTINNASGNTEASFSVAIGNDQNQKTQASNTQDSMSINPANKWIQIDVSNDNIQIAHETHAIEVLPTAPTSLNNSGEISQKVKDTITLQDIKFDNAGHVIENKPHTYTLPYGFQQFCVENNNIVTDAPTASTRYLSPKSTQDIMQFKASNRWIKFDTDLIASDDDPFTAILRVGHAAAGGEGQTTPAYDTNITPNFGETVDVPTITYDAAGHIVKVEQHKITIPKGSLNDLTATGSSVLTGIAMADETGVITQTNTDVGTLRLKQYGSTVANGIITENSTINSAFKALDTDLQAEEDNRIAAVADLQNQLNTEVSNRTNAVKAVNDRLDVLIGDGELKTAFDTIVEMSTWLDANDTELRANLVDADNKLNDKIVAEEQARSQAISNLTAEVNKKATKDDLNAAKARITTLENNLNAANQTISNLNDLITSLTTRLEIIEAKVELEHPTPQPEPEPTPDTGEEEGTI